MNKKFRKTAGILVSLSSFIVLLIIFNPLNKNSNNDINSILKKNNIVKPNIILFTLDTTRADHLPIYGYKDTETPVLSKLSHKGIVFESCITAETLTLPSHTSIMTGMFPTSHGVHINGNNAVSDNQVTLAEKIKKLGYKTAAFIAAFVLDGRWGLKQGFDYYDDHFDLEKFGTIDLGRVQRPANEVVDSALKWLEENKKQPFFSWIHFYDPHTPYAPPKPYLEKYESRGRVGLYDGEISFMDSQIGRVILWLNKNELMKNTIIVFVGDHGESLGEHKEDTHGYFIYDSTVRVPLMIVTPFKRFNNRRVKTQVRTIDVFPTILDVLQIQKPSNIQGKSLLPLFFKDERDRFAYMESLAPRLQYNWGALYGIRTTQYKYIEAPRPEFYDLLKDEKELNNIYKKKKKISRKLRKKIYNIIKEAKENNSKVEATNLDSETLSKLATLGYLGTVNTQKTFSLKENRKLADPKDKVISFNMISLASEYISEKNYDKALIILEKVLKKDSENPQVRLLLAASYLHEKLYKKTKEHLDIILKKDPNNIKALITLANMFYKKNDYDNTKIICKKILSIDKNYTQALGLTGRTFMAQHKLDKALAYFKKAVEIQPKITLNKLALAKCLIKGKMYDEAKIHLESIFKLHPDYLEAHYNRALIYESDGDYESAEAEYLQEIKNHPDFIPARFNYAKIILSVNIDEYINQMRNIIRINSKSARGYIFLARGLLKKAKSYDDIINHVNNGLKLTNDSELKTLGYYILADVYNKKGEQTKLRKVLNKAKYYEAKIKKKE